MKKILTLLILCSLGSWGCSGEFWGGATTGAVTTGASYEYQANRQMNKLQDDYRSGKIDRKEYQARKEQIEKGSILY